MRKIFKTIIQHRIARRCAALAIVAAVGVGGYWYGTTRPQTLLVSGVTNIENDPTVTADFSVFWEAWKRIKDEALKGPDLAAKDMVYGAVGGLVHALGDPNSVFFPPSDAQKFEEDVTGNFGGIGAEIGMKDDQVVVIAPLKDSPSEKAGIRSGDMIVKIDDKITTGMNVLDAVKLIRGPKGTPVALSIIRTGWNKPKAFSVVRDTVMVPTMDWKMLDNHIGYVHIMNFNENAQALFARAAKELVAQGINGIIIDVRDDPGGFLDVAVNLAGWFVEKGSVVVTEEFRKDANPPTTQYRADGNGLFAPVPVVVLINEGSASASEILAGALRDDHGAKTVGAKSFGKGTVQELKRLHDGSSMKITIAHWLMPKGDLIDKNGITPDYAVAISDDDAKKGRDPQLLKAQEVMKELVAKAVAAKGSQ